MSQSSDLFRLQRIDTRRDQAVSKIKEIDQIIQSDQSVQRAQRLHDEAESKLHTAQLSLRQIEDLASAAQIKLEQNQASLYGGIVKNPKELQDLQNEAAALKRHLSTLEDQQLDAMISLEEAERNQQSSLTHFHQVEADIIQKNSGLVHERSVLQKEIETLDSERQASANQIPAAMMTQYERLRQQKRGVAVAQVVDQTCDVCGSGLTPAEWQAARSPQQISYCPACGRILYAG